MERDSASQSEPHPSCVGSRLLTVVRFEFPMTVTTKIVVFWDVTPFSLVDIYQSCILHGVISQGIISLHHHLRGDLKRHVEATVHIICTFWNHDSTLKMEAVRFAEAPLGTYQATSQNTVTLPRISYKVTYWQFYNYIECDVKTIINNKWVKMWENFRVSFQGTTPAFALINGPQPRKFLTASKLFGHKTEKLWNNLEKPTLRSFMACTLRLIWLRQLTQEVLKKYLNLCMRYSV
jgi:hypothetical protein